MHWVSMPLVSLLLLAGCASAPTHELLVSTSLEPGRTAALEHSSAPAAAAYEVASLPEPARVDATAELALAAQPEPAYTLGQQVHDEVYDHPHNVHHDGVQPDSYYDHPHYV